MGKKILITGASIAGPAVAWWLSRRGMDVTVVERSPAFRDGGQTVDIRGASRTVMQRMGLEDRARARSTHEVAWAWVDEKDRERARFDVAKFGGEGPVADLEILRGELAKLIVEDSRQHAEYRYNDSIASISEGPDAVRVRFASGEERSFDLVVVAEGVVSSTRKMLWGDAVQRRPFDVYTAYFTIPKGEDDDDVARWYNAPGGLGVFVRPDNLGTTRAALNMVQRPNGLEKRPVAEQKAVLAERFAHLGWKTPRVLAGMREADDFYLEAIGQVRIDRWSRGRVVLVGDAAYCASPLSGMGTALALVGAYVLAGEIARNPDHAAAFAAYERIIRPYAENAQNVPSLAPRFGQPKTRLGIAFQGLFLRLLTVRALSWVSSKLLTTPANQIDLPDYGLDFEFAERAEARPA